MKKLISLGLAAAMVLSLAACGSSKSDSAATTAAAEEAQSTEAAAAGETAAEAETTAAAEAAGEPVSGGTLKIALNRTISAQSLDPLYIDSTTADQICQNYGDCLVLYDALTGEYIPNIATDWTISDDGLTYTFTIRDDVYFQPGKFQDGRKMTAEDVAYSLERAKDYWCNYLYYLGEVKVVDDTHVSATIDFPNATFLYDLTSSSVIMVAKEEVEGWGEDYGMHVVGTGAFQVVEHVVDQYTKLVRNENYWGEKPYLDGVDYYIITDGTQEVNALKTGEVDVIVSLQGTDVPDVQAVEGLDVMQSMEARVYYFGFNMENEYLSNPLVRQALIEAVDSEQIYKAAFTNNTGVYSILPIPLNSWGYNKDMEALVPKYDPEAAKQHLAEAGYPGGGFTLTVTTSDDSTRMRAATVLQSYWAEIGVNLEIKTASTAEVTETYTSGTSVISSSGQGGSTDPSTFLGYFFSSEKVHTNYNTWNFVDPEIDKLIEEAVSITDQAERKPLYDKILEAGVKENVGIFYGTGNLNWAYNTKVHGLEQEGTAVLKLTGSKGENVWIEQ